MDTTALSATTRDTKAKAHLLRKERKIPAELYGPNTENAHLLLEYQAFRKAYKAAGKSGVVELSVEDKKTPVLVHRVDTHPVSDEFEHVEFLAIDMNRPVTTHVPITFVGVSPAVKNLGGILTTTKAEVTVRALPAKLPHDFQLSLEGLTELHATLHVSDISAGEGVEILDAPEVVLVSIAAPKTKEEVEADLAADVGDSVSAEQREETDAEKEASKASKESDTEKKGDA